jgi:hypothetical protein
MRFAVLAVALCGCSLYFGQNNPPEDDVVPPTEYPDAGGTEFYCAGTTIYETFDGTRDYTNPVGTCPFGCAFTTFYQDDQPCLESAPPPVYSCTESGSCAADATDSCAAPLQCGVVVSAGACTCDSGTWSCADACNQGLCGAAAVQAEIAGDWSGTVTPPSFAAPYQIQLHIGQGGLWRATATGGVNIPFYYGDDGNNLGSRIVIQAQTTTGAYASIGLFDGEVQGLITGISVDATHMTFAFVDSWLSCSRTFYFDLER